DLSNLDKPNGNFLMAVPNFKSFDARQSGKFWAAYDVARHLWRVSKEAVQRRFSNNFEMKYIKPMIFDSFYVSLLSENYKTGNKFSLRALWIGFKSNLLAKRTKEYSSHIYCFNRRNEAI